MKNPDPARITDEMWRLWEERPNPAWKLGGIYANKKGYHNTVQTNLAKWPNNYSVRLVLDLGNTNRDKARAIDLTMTESEMIKWTRRMKLAALDPIDTRLDCIREFYGTLDGKTVYGLIKDSIGGDWRESTADLTHLWHGHVSIFTTFVTHWPSLSRLLSVWRGESFVVWRTGDMHLPRKGESGEHVRFWQHTHNQVRELFNPPLAQLKTDGDYGDTTAAAFIEFWKKSGGAGTYTAPILSGWTAMQYMKALAKVSVPNEPQLAFPTQQVKEIVEQWLAANVGTSFDFNGQVEGRITVR